MKIDLHLNFSKKIIFSVFLLFLEISFSQNIELYQQFNGRYDFTMIGNTLNYEENGQFVTCDIATTSSATLTLDATNQVEAAYLYWAGSGTGDFEVTLNGQSITAERTFLDTYNNIYDFFSCFANITTIVQNQGNTVYTLSDLDLQNVIPYYCDVSNNFGGWAILIIYKNDILPLNQLNIYDGLEHVWAQEPELIINIDNLYVLDNTNAKIGFLAWEGDSGIAVNETLQINGNVIGNPPLNPATNAFNGTNSFTGQSDLFNMDLDFYYIDNYLQIGDTNVEVKLTSGQDFVMVNTIVTKLNSQLPDATVSIDQISELDCYQHILNIDFTVYNEQGSGVLPQNTPVSIYINNQIQTTILTEQDLSVGQSASMSVTLELGVFVENEISILFVVDDDGTQNGIILELDESNNTAIDTFTFNQISYVAQPDNLVLCDTGNQLAEYNLESVLPQLEITLFDTVGFFLTENDAIENNNSIQNITAFNNTQANQEIFIRVTNTESNCYTIVSFLLETEACLPYIPQIVLPDSADNSVFFIDGLQDIYKDYKLKIFNRYGNIVYTGDNNTALWDGTYKGKRLPAGTYFYVLYLNDTQNQSYKGWVYLMY